MSTSRQTLLASSVLSPLRIAEIGLLLSLDVGRVLNRSHPVGANGGRNVVILDCLCKNLSNKQVSLVGTSGDKQAQSSHS